MSDILRLTASLVAIALLSGFAVGVTNQKTQGAIEQQKLQAKQSALLDVMPPGATVEERHGSGGLPPTYWAATVGGQVVSYAFEAQSRGYAADIKMMVGLDTSGEILGISVLGQKETPGLGTRVAEVVSKRYLWSGFGGSEAKAEPWFTEQFEGIDLDESVKIDKSGEWHTLTEAQRDTLEQRNAISAITGATISTRAVVRGLETVVFPYLRALREGVDR
jgi:electron transport complex protein RnfG